jgi:hypothetical protein
MFAALPQNPEQMFGGQATTHRDAQRGVCRGARPYVYVYVFLCVFIFVVRKNGKKRGM